MVLAALPLGIPAQNAFADPSNNPLLLGAESFETQPEDHSIRLYFKSSSFQPIMKESRSNSSLMIKLGNSEHFETFLNFLKSNTKEESLTLLVPPQNKEKIIKKSKGGISRSEIDSEWVEVKLNMEIVNLKKFLESKSQSFDLVQWTKNFLTETRFARNQEKLTTRESQHSTKTLPQEQIAEQSTPQAGPTIKVLHAP